MYFNALVDAFQWMLFSGCFQWMFSQWMVADIATRGFGFKEAYTSPKGKGRLTKVSGSHIKAVGQQRWSWVDAKTSVTVHA